LLDRAELPIICRRSLWISGARGDQAMERKHQDHAASTERMVDYDRNSYMQDQMVRSRAEWLRAAVERIGPVAPEFTVMDYGCGPGHSALDAVAPVIEAYRRIDPQGAMVVRHSDQAGNDWSALFALVFGPDGYRRHSSGIRTEAVVGSFYTQLAAPGSVALATCFVASHWLSRALSPYSPGTVWFADLQGEARAEFAALARADWTNFLRRRAAELRPGGMAIVSTLGSVPDESEINGIRVSARKLYRAIFDVANQMVTDGVLKASALDHFVFSLWFPTVEEARAPIEGEPDLKEAFEIVEAAVAPAAVHPNDVYEASLGDPPTYARLYAGYIRGFGESSLRLHLFAPSAKNAAEVDALTEDFFERLTRYYQAEPGRHASESMIMTLVLRRR
jgi:SAM dependent carboxyl methyltransferase